MPVHNSDYLNTPFIKNEQWVMEICAAETPEELSGLILKRIVHQDIYGPTLSKVTFELPSQIIYDLVSEGHIDHKLFYEAMAIITNKFIKNESVLDFKSLKNIFFLMERLAAEDCSDDLYLWIKQNISFLESSSAEERNIFLDALGALVYVQKETQEGLEELWTLLWDQSNQFWWNTAFLGIRYLNFKKSILLIPELIDRKCSNAIFILKSMMREKDDDMLNLLQQGIKDQKLWAGIAVNNIAFDMKWAEKHKLVNRLYDTPLSLIKDDDPMSMYERHAY